MKTLLIVLLILVFIFFCIYFYFSKNYPTGYFLKDNQIVFGYWEAGGHEILQTELNPQNWQLIGDTYAKDDNIVVMSGHILKDADPLTFQRIKVNPSEIQDFYSKDKNFVYAGRSRLENVDPKTVELYPHNFLKDQNAVYYKHKKLENADPTTFKMIEHPRSDSDSPKFMDKNHSYDQFGQIVK